MVKLGLALYSVRYDFLKDPIKTLERVRATGYKYIEAANYHIDDDPLLGCGMKPKEVKNLFQRLDLKLVNCHIGRSFYDTKGSNSMAYDIPRLLELTDDEVKRCSEANLAVGNNRLTVPITFYENNKDAIMRKCEYLNRICDVAKENGTQMFYHPHFQEYVLIDGKLILEYLYENTKLLYELDTYWIMRGGEDPIDILKRFGEKVIFVHQKDFPKNVATPVNIWHCLGNDMKTGKYPDRAVKEKEFFICDIPEVFTEIGSGIMPVQDIINTINEYTKTEFLIVEQDHSTFEDDLKSIDVSMKYIKKCTGVEIED